MQHRAKFATYTLIVVALMFASVGVASAQDLFLCNITVGDGGRIMLDCAPYQAPTPEPTEEPGYPQRSGQTVTWRAVFGADDANNAWNEFTVVNAASDSGTNLNRRVSAQGTKASGQTWTVDVSLTIS